MKIIGIILIVAGILGLAYGGFTYTKDSESVDLGVVDVSVKEKESVPVSPIVAGVGLVAGIIMVAASGGRGTD